MIGRKMGPEKGRLKLLIAGGGTGGHLFPGIAVAQEWVSRNRQNEVLFVTGRRKIESDILTRAGFRQVSIPVEGIKGRGWRNMIMTMLGLPYSLIQSLSIIREFDPHIILGVGGYSAGPVCLASRMLGFPTVIHEQNSYPGLTNRLLSRIVHRVMISFDESKAYLKSNKILLTGNPIRSELIAMTEQEKDINQPFRILVMGGSQGAKSINRTFIDALTLLKERGSSPEVIHQTGRFDYQEVLEIYQEKGIQADIKPFIDHMKEAYAWADLVINRAGASTVSELAALGKPSILIPYPYASNNHQEVNAGLLAKKGGAEMVLEKDLNGTKLAELIWKYIENPEGLLSMGKKAKALGRPDATGIIVDKLLEMAV
jgi:UDP-N-acetylglucosamine--N-acetylmuramyl-(pentapeptide) pyrophosphoryl-undecaprenol N-acetylglucosamine transferase